MRLLEFQTKELLAREGVAIPRAVIARVETEVEAAATALGGPVVLKAQLAEKDRLRKGLVQFAANASEARACAVLLLNRGRDGKGFKLLVEERLAVEQELYLAVTYSGAARGPLVLAHARGGTGIEVRQAQSGIASVHASNPACLSEAEACLLWQRAGVDTAKLASLVELARLAYGVFRKYDLALLEINPVALIADAAVAIDARAVVDDAAVFRQPEIGKLSVISGRTPEADDLPEGLGCFVPMGGRVGVITNGAGLCMAIVDLLTAAGTSVAVACDLGPAAARADAPEVVQAVLTRMAALPGCQRVFISILGGGARCEPVADGIRNFLKRGNPPFGITLRLRGNGDIAAKELLADTACEWELDLQRAVQRLGLR